MVWREGKYGGKILNKGGEKKTRGECMRGNERGERWKLRGKTCKSKAGEKRGKVRKIRGWEWRKSKRKREVEE